MKASPTAGAWPYVLPSKVPCAAAAWRLIGISAAFSIRLQSSLPNMHQPPAHAQVSPGDLMPVAAGDGLRLARVVSVEAVADEGVYMPHTWSGDWLPTAPLHAQSPSKQRYGGGCAQNSRPRAYVPLELCCASTYPSHPQAPSSSTAWPPPN